MIKLEKFFSHQQKNSSQLQRNTNFSNDNVTNKQVCVSGFNFKLFKGYVSSVGMALIPLTAHIFEKI